MDGLELAHLLGRGSFGWVYYGTWFGTPVAVKVCRQTLFRVLNVHLKGFPGVRDVPAADELMQMYAKGFRVLRHRDSGVWGRAVAAG